VLTDNFVEIELQHVWEGLRTEIRKAGVVAALREMGARGGCVVVLAVSGEGGSELSTIWTRAQTTQSKRIRRIVICL
jgi:hypothetical protein